MLDVKTFTHNLLTIEINEDSSSIAVNFKGKSIERNPTQFISPIFFDLLEKSSETNKKICIDFRNLEFMNSSTITPITKMMEKGKNGSHHISILFSKSRRWQELCFSALKIFETKDKRIEIIGN